MGSFKKNSKTSTIFNSFGKFPFKMEQLTQSVRETYISFADICKTLVGISTHKDFIPKMALQVCCGVICRKLKASLATTSLILRVLGFKYFVMQPFVLGTIS